MWPVWALSLPLYTAVILPGRVPPPKQISAALLDAAVRERVAAVLLDHHLIAQEIARLQTEDATMGNLASVARALAEIERKQRKAAQAITVLDADADAPLVAELTALSQQQRQLARIIHRPWE